MPRESISTDLGIEDRLRERFSSEEDLTELSPHQIERLAEQMGSILSIRAGGTMDDYISMMESWGGVLELSDQDIAEIDSSWTGPQHPDTISLYAIDDLHLVVQDSPSQPAFRQIAPGEFALASISQFRFKTKQSDLLQGRTKEAQVLMNAETNGGDQLELQYSLLWSPQDDRWIPFQMTTVSKKGKPIPGRIF